MRSSRFCDWLENEYFITVIKDVEQSRRQSPAAPSPWQVVSSEPLVSTVPQLPEPDMSRLFAADVRAQADKIYGPPPYVLTIEQRREIATELDKESGRE